MRTLITMDNGAVTYLSTDNVSYILQVLTQTLGQRFDLAQLSPFMNKTIQQFPNINNLPPQQYLTQLNNYTIQALLSPNNGNGQPAGGMPSMQPGGPMGNNMVGMAPGGSLPPGMGSNMGGEDAQLSPDGQSLARMAEQLRRERYTAVGPALAGNNQMPMMTPGQGGMYQSSRDLNMTDQMAYKLEQERRMNAGQAMNGQIRTVPLDQVIQTPANARNFYQGAASTGMVPGQGQPPANGTMPMTPGGNPNNVNGNVTSVPTTMPVIYNHPAMAANVSGERLLSLDFTTDVSDYEEGGIVRLSFPSLAGVYRLELLSATLRHSNVLERPSYLYCRLAVNGHALTGNCLTAMADSNSRGAPMSFFAKLVPRRVSHNGYIDYEPLVGSSLGLNNNNIGIGASAFFNPPLELSTITIGFHDQRGESLDLRPFSLKRIVRLDANQGVQITTHGPHRCVEGDTLLLCQRTENGPTATAVRVATVLSADTLTFAYQSSTVQQLNVYQKQIAGHLTFRLLAQ